jgi:hypothetical protein
LDNQKKTSAAVRKVLACASIIWDN